jgi:hypothetical protein
MACHLLSGRAGLPRVLQGEVADHLGSEQRGRPAEPNQADAGGESRSVCGSSVSTPGEGCMIGAERQPAVLADLIRLRERFGVNTASRA